MAVLTAADNERELRATEEGHEDDGQSLAEKVAKMLQVALAWWGKPDSSTELLVLRVALQPEVTSMAELLAVASSQWDREQASKPAGAG